MKHIALVTYEALLDLTPSEQLLREKLSDYQIKSSAVSWHDTAVDWSQFDAVIIRSPWDYHKHPIAFRQWLNDLLARGIVVYNPIPALLWNMEKTYLRELSEQGVKIIPTVWANQALDIASIMQAQGWEEGLLKPVFGAGSDGIYIIDPNAIEEAQKTLSDMLTIGEVIIQPIVKEVRKGELSIVFFDHQYSHTLRKTPQGDAVLLDPEEPSAIQLDQAPQFAIDTALTILEKAQAMMQTDHFLYARVDGVIVNNEFLLMELELLEPHLFLDLAGQMSAEMFAKAIQKRLSDS
jgi:glutathione synthase/RimK-type ligase-like ATP-grasp enzyme